MPRLIAGVVLPTGPRTVDEIRAYLFGAINGFIDDPASSSYQLGYFNALKEVLTFVEKEE